jgi:DNA-binding NtrC family response regulator
VDDEADMVETCRKILERKSYAVTVATDSQRALEEIRQQPFDVVIADLRMPGLDGIEILREAKRVNQDAAVIIITAYATIETALKAVREGAFDYIPKPFSMEQLEVAVERSLAYRQLREENRTLQQQIRQSYDFSRIVGNSPQITEVLQIASRVVDTDANLLLYGESGTGKELIARSIHANSPRVNHAFVPIDCAALPENLLESELFGYEKGAFTGALTTRRGLIEYAQGGTLFLDEVGDLTPAMQAKLLRVLQERQFRRVGGRDLLDVDVRLISATHRNLEEMVQQNLFREDLFYRLNVLTIRLPALRERAEDIPLLARHCLEEFRTGARKTVEGISSAAMMLLQRYPWPGNIRELRNAIERAVSLADGNQITPMDLPEAILCLTESCAKFSTDVNFRQAKEQVIQGFEREYLQQCLRLTRGNVSAAAVHAGMPRSAFHRLMKKQGLLSDDFRPPGSP